ncbi:MAG TPA: TIGR00730 family Rossman fold protein [Bryobacteraceae bacterium]|nr:TIGR00730 family Rossman fold protein [Bryobacteraceae bacterium]
MSDPKPTSPRAGDPAADHIDEQRLPAADRDRDPDHAGHPLLAYRNQEFLDTSEARSLRILSEYLYPLAHFRKENVQDTVVFFGSARTYEMGPNGRYYNEARELARRITEWSNSLPHEGRRFVVCSGGGPGIMEAANRGAQDAGGKTVGLNIGLPFEQRPNPFITPELCFEFHYFFMRKFWFAYLAKALIVFPGGFGTLDELTEILTLVQTQKLLKKMVVLLYGSAYWKEIINFEALVKHGMIATADLELFTFADDVDSAFKLLVSGLTKYWLEGDREVPAISKTQV